MSDEKKAAAASALQLERADLALDHLQDVNLGDKALNDGAFEATAQEHNMGFVQAMKTYKRAAFWSALISASIIMEGYDVTLLGSFYAYPSFRERYGEFLNEERGYQISADWQTKFNCLGAFANICGAIFNGWATARFGHRIVLMGSFIFLTGSIFVSFFAPSIEILLLGQFLCDLPWGVFATTGPSYAAEVTPLAIRGYLTAYVNLCWCIGQFISAGVLKGLVSNPTQWGYRIPFAIQWVWPVPLFIATFLAPESPWFLVRTGNLDEAKKALQRLSEKDLTTEIACMSFLSQITNGGALCYSGSFFFLQTGINAEAAYGISLGGTGIAFVGTIISWFYIHRFGRRTIWLAGFGCLVVILWTIGFLALPSQTKPLAWGQSLLCVVWLGAYSMSVGPIVYTIVSEIGSTRLRTQTVVLGRSIYYVGNIVCGGTIQPRLLSPGAWNAKGKTALCWAALASLTYAWGYFRMFETRGRTFGELDFMFQKGVSARQSANYVVDKHEVFATQDAREARVADVKR
ncbi:major facilitator superfamily domain-containing protein [Podospora aff. communis PSN243]|uniref:Major facilitator superfamily domain-containing protein n=1 Tax=Podospora aff. communis PSN243 TaxID=3040156 RepID=A0AAV9GIP2_9PEZI|nr:major facilitator superfamily domain-containing protein [Podospora aff. communis PSN243]